MKLEVEWSKIKDFISAKNLHLHYVEFDTAYYIYVIDGIFSIYCKIEKTNPTSSEQTDFENNYKINANKKVTQAVQTSPFSDKIIDGKKLFARTYGASFNLTTGQNVCDFSMPLNIAKFNGLEVVNCEVGDTVDLIVLDTPQGHIQLSMGIPLENVVPSAPLNQFGFNVGLPNNFYSRESKYDADIIKDMVIRVVYQSVSDKTVTVNYGLHELK